jgi:hypothetical protein
VIPCDEYMSNNQPNGDETIACLTDWTLPLTTLTSKCPSSPGSTVR